ncbi:MAG: SUMF1/EgtB/PvdO family nonheme iron enzyme [Deltaproteobacteria bacterium]|nr:SUMF1/EgtB/PvdO family nonheme iron enzyme [Deltaproteobacteria bacterium]
MSMVVSVGCYQQYSGDMADAGRDGGPADDESAVDPGGDTDSDQNSNLVCLTNGLCEQPYCDQILIPGGVFPMGANTQTDIEPHESNCIDHDYGDSTPRFQVRLESYCIDKYETSLERYLACVEAGVCVGPSDYSPENEQLAEMTAGCSQAQTYCNWIGRRLCTEAEWERAVSDRWISIPAPSRRRGSTIS